MKEWFVWEHKDHSGLEIGPRMKDHETIYNGLLKDNVDAVVTMRGIGWANGHHVITPKQREDAQMIADAVNAYQQADEWMRAARIGQ